MCPYPCFSSSFSPHGPSKDIRFLSNGVHEFFQCWSFSFICVYTLLSVVSNPVTLSLQSPSAFCSLSLPLQIAPSPLHNICRAQRCSWCRHALYPLINSSCRLLVCVENGVCIMVKPLPFCLVASWWSFDIQFPLCPFSLLLYFCYLHSSCAVSTLFWSPSSLVDTWTMWSLWFESWTLPHHHHPRLIRLSCALCQSVTESVHTPSIPCESSVPSYFSRFYHNNMYFRHSKSQSMVGQVWSL